VHVERIGTGRVEWRATAGERPSVVIRTLAEPVGLRVTGSADVHLRVPAG
jgi:hypothetical protein